MTGTEQAGIVIFAAPFVVAIAAEYSSRLIRFIHARIVGN